MIRKLLNNKLLGSAAIYTITSGINSAIPFFLMPILTRYLSPSDYGITAMFGVLVSFVTPFTGLNIDAAVMRQYYEKDEIDFPSYIGNCLFILLISTCLVGCMFYFLSEPISRVSSFPRQWLWVVIIVSMAQFISQIILMLWRVQVKPLSFGSYQIAQTIFNMGLTLWFVVGLGMAWQGRIKATLIATVLFGMVATYFLYKNGWVKWQYNNNYIKHALKFGVPMIPHALGGTIMTMTDRIFITNMVGLSATGLYSVGYSFGMIIGIIQDSFNKAYGPWLFEKLKADDSQYKRKIVKITYAYYIIIILLVIVLTLIAPWFLSFFVGEKFRGASVFIFWIGLGYAFNGMYKMVVNYIFYVEKTHILAWVTFFCAGINIILNYCFIKINGAVGAAQATTATFFLGFVLTWILSNRVYPMPWLKK